VIIERSRTPIAVQPWSMCSMETELSSREQAIAIYCSTIMQAAELGAASVHRVKRKLAQSDLFFLLVYVLGRADLNRDWYFARCREVEAAPNGYLDLWGREHGKSSLITFGLTIQDILNDPEITVAIFSYSRPIAKAFLRQIKVEFESNEMLRALFPDILWANPHRDAPKFSEDDGIIVRRKGNPKGITRTRIARSSSVARRLSGAIRRPLTARLAVSRCYSAQSAWPRYVSAWARTPSPHNICWTRRRSATKRFMMIGCTISTRMRAAPTRCVNIFWSTRRARRRKAPISPLWR